MRLPLQLLVFMESLKACCAIIKVATEAEVLVSNVGCRPRRQWRFSFLAEARDVAPLRAALRPRLECWGHRALVEPAQLCVSELVANVIQHVGPGTPTTVVLSTCGAGVRIEVHDPNLRALPTLIGAGPEAEAGRGMALIDALADRWGVDLTPERKATWCELGVGAIPAGRPSDHVGQPAACCDDLPRRQRMSAESRVRAALEEERAISVVVDLLVRLRSHGWEPDELLDQAQARFEADAG